MRERLLPPEDIDPGEFFTRWIPEAVRSDDARRSHLATTEAVLQFELEGDGGGHFHLLVVRGEVVGAVGAAPAADLRVRLDVETWRALNRGSLSAPEAFLRRRVHLSGNLALAIKLHLIIG
jgi:putative sterol carrier protein